MKGIVTPWAMKEAFRVVPNRSRKDARELLVECASDYIETVIAEAQFIAGPRRVITRLVIRKAIYAVDQIRTHGLEIDMRDPDLVGGDNDSEDL